jgi:hypothetical protein
MSLRPTSKMASSTTHGSSVEHTPETLETVTDNLSDEKHHLLDVEVLDNPAIQEPSKLLAASFLLTRIVLTSEGRLDPKYGDLPNAIDFLQNNCKLIDMLNTAWAGSTFRNIRNLSS